MLFFFHVIYVFVHPLQVVAPKKESLAEAEAAYQGPVEP